MPSIAGQTQGRIALLAGLCLAAGALRAEPPAAEPPAAEPPAAEPPSSTRTSSAPQMVHAEPGMFGKVGVLDQGDDRYLVFGGQDGDQQSWIKKGKPGALPMEYLQSAAVALGRRPHSVLLIGLGGGAFASFIAARFPATSIEAVEIDPVVVKVARAYFALPASVKVHVADGGAFLDKTRDRWDLILVDAYGSDDYPKHLGTAAFFETVRGHLSEGGAAVLNIAATNRQTERQLLTRFSAALGSCFDIPVDSKDADNTVLFGTRSPTTLSAMRERVRGVARSLRGVPVVSLARRATVCAPSPPAKKPSPPSPSARQPTERLPVP